MFECLAERTIALAQLRKAHDPDAGYDPLLAERMRAVLPACAANGVTIVTNMGAANPVAGAAMVRAVARELGLAGLPVAAITGDDVLDVVTGGGFAIDETGAPVESLGDALVSANAYIGASPIVDALAQGARVVVTGRAADPSLFVGPIRHAFGWTADDWPLIGRATAVGHLLECAGQVTGGYFAGSRTHRRRRARSPRLPDRRGRRGRHVRSSPRCRAPAARSRSRPAASSCSMRLATRRPT